MSRPQSVGNVHLVNIEPESTIYPIQPCSRIPCTQNPKSSDEAAAVAQRARGAYSWPGSCSAYPTGRTCPNVGSAQPRHLGALQCLRMMLTSSTKTRRALLGGSFRDNQKCSAPGSAAKVRASRSAEGRAPLGSKPKPASLQLGL